MAKEIAVWLGTNGSSASLDEPGRIAVFRRAQGSWQVNREKELSICQARGIRELRMKMAEMLQLMDGCQVFVARSASGIPFFELEKAGCSVWEYQGRPESFLERVWDQEEKEKAMVTVPASQGIPAPEEKTPGNFYISLVDVQRNNAEVSSKQILQRFIRQGRFRTMEIHCSHIPPWIETEAMSMGLCYSVEQLSLNELRIRLKKSGCEL
jgi:Fe-only nitrogenase accessory protein AnfO